METTRYPALSVIVPCYNASESLDRCLKGLSQSTFRSFEVIVVDDGSTDNTREIVQRYPVSLVSQQQNRGVAFARNEGARRARGEVLLFLDADVVVRKDTLSRTMELLEADEVDIVCAIYAKDTPLKGFGPRLGVLFDHYYYHTWPSGVRCREISCFLAYCGAVRSKVFWKAGGFNEGIAGAGVEDYEFGRAIRRLTPIWQYRELDVVHLRRGILRRGRELFRRSQPFLDYFLSTRSLEQNDSSVNGREIGSMLAMLGTTVGLFVGPILPAGFVFGLGSYGVFLVLNTGLFRFVYKEAGPVFAAAAIPSAMFISASLGWGISIAAVRSLGNLAMGRKDGVFGTARTLRKETEHVEDGDGMQ